jgi:hypothetical protein
MQVAASTTTCSVPWTLGARFNFQCLGTRLLMLFLVQHVQHARVVCGDNHPGRRNVDVYLLQGDKRRRGECAREQAADVHRRDGLADDLFNDRGEDRRRVGSVRAEPADVLRHLCVHGQHARCQILPLLQAHRHPLEGVAVPWRGGVLGSVQQQQDAQGPYVTGLLARLIGFESESGRLLWSLSQSPVIDQRQVKLGGSHPIVTGCSVHAVWCRRRTFVLLIVSRKTVRSLLKSV